MLRTKTYKEEPAKVLSSVKLRLVLMSKGRCPFPPIKQQEVKLTAGAPI